MDPEDRPGLWRRIRRFLEPQTATEVAGLIGTSMVPGVGTALDVADVAAGIQDRDPLRIGIGALAASIPFVSSAMLRSIGSVAKRFFKKSTTGKLLSRMGGEADDVGYRRVSEEIKVDKIRQQFRADVAEFSGKSLDDITAADMRSLVDTGHLTGITKLPSRSAIPSASRQSGIRLLHPGRQGPTLWHGTGVRYAPTVNNPLGEMQLKYMSSGEGYQMAGYGHYLGEARETGQSYKNMRSQYTLFDAQGRQIVLPPSQMRILSNQVSGGTSPSKALLNATDDLDYDISIGMERIADLEDDAEHFAMEIRSRRADGVPADHPTIKYNEMDYNESMQGALKLSNEMDELRGIRNVLADIDPVGLEVRSSGSLYKVKLHADPEHFIDWDAPPAWQPDYIRDMFPENLRSNKDTNLQFGPRADMQRGLVGGSMSPPMPDYDQVVSIMRTRPDLLERAILKYKQAAGNFPAPAIGAKHRVSPYRTHRDLDILIDKMREDPEKYVSTLITFVQDEVLASAPGIAGLPNMASAKSVSAALKERGVPGIKFWDQLSRKGGEGTRNYVVFGDEYLEIVDRFKEGGMVTA